MTSAPELRPAATSAAIVAVAGASSVILPTGAHWAVAGGAAIAAAVLAALHTRRVALLANDVATFTERVAAGEYGEHGWRPRRRSSCARSRIA